MEVTVTQVRQISLNQGKPEICAMVAGFLTTKGDLYQLDTLYRVKHFLGQTAIESAFFTRLEESLYYSAKRMTEVWPNRYPTIKAAQPYAQNPQALANHTYGGRMGNKGPNDGWLYRGSSIKMITGYDNFNAFNIWIHALIPNAPDFVKNPDALRTLEWAVYPAVWYWSTKNCAYYADRDDVKGLTRAINGGLIGLEDRKKATALAAKVFNAQTDPKPTVLPPKTPDLLLKEYQWKMGELSVKLKKPEFNPGKADGWNGTNTVKAVTAIQLYTNLNPDGKCGPNTRKAINQLCQKYGIPVEVTV